MRRYYHSQSGSVVVGMVIVIALAVMLMSVAFYRESLRGHSIALSAAISSEVQARNDMVGRWLLAALPTYIQTQMRASGNLGGNAASGFISTSSGAALLDTMFEYDGMAVASEVGFTASQHKHGDAGQFRLPLATFVGSTDQSLPSASNILTRSLAPYNGSDVLPVPDALFALRPPGGTFVARRYSYTANTRYDIGSDNLLSGTRASANPTRNRRITLYEVPFQSALSADNILQITSSSGVTIGGGVVATDVDLVSGNVAGNVMGTRQVSVAAGATVRSSAISLAAGYGAEVYAQGGVLANRSISTSGDAGRTLFLRINRGAQYYSAVASPTNWDLYTLPYYRTAVRVVINSSTPTATNVTISVHNPSTVPGMTATITSRTAQSDQASWTTQGFNSFLDIVVATANATDQRRMLRIDPAAMANAVRTWAGVSASFGGSTADQVAALNRIYVGAAINSPPTPNTAGDVCVTLNNALDISAFTGGFALVTKQRFYFTGAFNSTAVAAAVIAPQVRYGSDAFAPQVDIDGRVGFVGAAGQVVAQNIKHGSGTTLASKTMNLVEATTPAQIPPIVPVDWLLVLEEL